MTLTKVPTKVVDKYTAIRLAVYGEGGVGKTTLALTFPHPLVIDTDGGLEGDALIGADGKVVDAEEWTPDKWSDLNDLYNWLKVQIDKQGYKTIVIDSIDTLCRFLLHEAVNLPTTTRPSNAEESELASAEKRDFGKVSHATDIFLTKLKNLSKAKGIHIVLTSAVRYPDPELGRTKRTFDVQPAVESNLIYWANIYGELDVVTTTTGEGKAAKQVESRVLWTNAGDRKRKNKTRWAALRPGVTEPTFSKIDSLIHPKAAPAKSTRGK
jgi:GTPase SAR1 family protein